MKTKRSYFCWLLVILLALGTLVSFGKAGATNCYKLYYDGTCSDYDWENWDYINIALHKDKNWEGCFDGFGYAISGNWNVFGNAIKLYLSQYSVVPSRPAWSQQFTLFAGTKSGQVKFLTPPPKSKINVSKAQGFFKYLVGQVSYVGCWYLEKANLSECPWVNEGGSMTSEMDDAEMDEAEE